MVAMVAMVGGAMGEMDGMSGGRWIVSARHRAQSAMVPSEHPVP